MNSLIRGQEKAGAEAPRWRLFSVVRRIGDPARLALATTRQEPSEAADTWRIFKLIRSALEIWPDLYADVALSAVDEIPMGAPLTAAARDAVDSYLENKQLDGVFLGYGTGAKNSLSGLFLGCLESTFTVDLVPLQEGHGRTSLTLQSDARGWLSRKRHFRGLAELAECAGNERESWAWKALHCRQIQDDDGFRYAVGRAGLPELEKDEFGPRSHHSVESALLDRLLRNEVAALLQVRSWIYDHYRELVESEPDGSNWPEIGKRTLGPLIGSVEDNHELAGRLPREFLVSSSVKHLNEVASSVAHDALTASKGFRRADGYFREIAEAADRRDPRRKLGLSPNPARWSSLPSGRLLVVQCVGGQDLRPQLTAILDHDFQNIRIDEEVEEVNWKIDILMIASVSTADKAQREIEALWAALERRWSQAAQPEGHDGGEVYDGRLARLRYPIGITLKPAPPSESGQVNRENNIEMMRAEIVDSIRVLDATFALRDAEAVVFLGGPATHGMNLAAALAALDWAVKEGCPAYVGSIDEIRHTGPAGPPHSTVSVSDRHVLALPTYDGLLKNVAARQVESLEFVAAAATLRRGGRELRDIAGRVDDLRRDAFDWDSARAALIPEVEKRREEAARRLELVRALGKNDGWGSVCLATAICEHVLKEEKKGNKGPWEEGPLKNLSRIRNNSPTTHNNDHASLAKALSEKLGTPVSQEDALDVLDLFLEKVQKQLLEGIMIEVDIAEYRSRYEDILDDLRSARSGVTG
ncbi:hypothetical protein [Frankia sp. CiP1_Cm_nod1]|uniref:hypothetical protein n=1 Tax=Frankia sp. CiP1_Cm_nod1 TaxID=2897160 RepID=UPI002024F8D4